MTIDFSSARRRLMRAQRHIGELLKVEQEYFSNSPPAFNMYVTPKGGVVTFRLTAKIPHDANDALDDALGVLREALEHAIFAFAEPSGLTSRKELRALQFPTGETEEAFSKTLKETTRGLPDELRDCLRYLQPWLRNSADEEGQSAALWVLHDLAAHKRHRFLTAVKIGTMPSYLSFGNQTRILLGPQVQELAPPDETGIFAWEGAAPEYRPAHAFGIKDMGWVFGGMGAIEAINAMHKSTAEALTSLEAVGATLFGLAD